MPNEKQPEKEEAVLEQTFGEYGEESAQTATATPVAEEKNGNQKKSGNALLILGAGGAAVLFVAYKFFVAPMMNPTAQHNVSSSPNASSATIATAPAGNVRTSVTAPVTTPPVTTAIVNNVPGAIGNNIPANATNTTNTTNTTITTITTPNVVTGPAAGAVSTTGTDTTLAKEFMSASGALPGPPQNITTISSFGDTPASIAPIITVSTPSAATVSPVLTVSPVVSTQPPIQTVTVTSALPNVGTGGTNTSTSINTTMPRDESKVLTMLEEIRGLFEKQTKDTGDSIGSLDKRVSMLEKSQTDLVKNMEDKLLKLNNNRTKHFSPTVVAQNSGKNNLPKRLNSTPENMGRDDVLFTKSADLPVVSSVKENKEEESLEKYSIHAIYGNRFYLRNADGTHKSYVVGDKLPEGEVVTKIDDEKYQIVTTKGIIRAF